MNFSHIIKLYNISSCTYYVLCVVVNAPHRKWRESRQSPRVGYEMVTLDIAAHPWHVKSRIFSREASVRWSFGESLIIVTDASRSQAVAPLIVHTDLIECSFIGNNNKGQNIPKSFSTLIVKLYLFDLRVFRILELNLYRNCVCTAFDLCVYKTGEVFYNESLEVVHVDTESVGRVVDSIKFHM